MIDSNRQKQPFPTNLKEKCSKNLPMIEGEQGVQVVDPLEWYQEEYTKCAANHNGLINAMEARGLK